MRSAASKATSYPIDALSNGIRVVAAPIRDRASVSVGIWVHAGARDETPRLNGASHLLEHLLFKGTARRSASRIKQDVEGVGGTLNAFTSEECTCFLARVSLKHLPKVFDTLSDMVLNASLKTPDIEKERFVVLEEIKMAQDQPAELAEEMFVGLLWPQHALGRPITGTLKSVGMLSPRVIHAYRDNYYQPGFITVVASGAIERKELLRLVRSHFESQKPSRTTKNIELFKRAQTHAQIKLFSKATQQTQIVLGMHALPKNHPDEFALDLLSVLLGGNMSSRLFNKVREERVLAYDIGTGVHKFHETGSFNVSAGVDPSKSEEALRVILAELEKVARKFVPNDELKRAKEFYLGQLDLALENTINHMLWVGDSVVSQGRARTHAEIVRGVKRVTREDIRRIAALIFTTNSLNLAGVGPQIGNLEEKFRKILSFHR